MRVLICFIFIFFPFYFVATACNESEILFNKVENEKTDVFDGFIVEKSKYIELKNIYLKNVKSNKEKLIDEKIKSMDDSRLLKELSGYPGSFQTDFRRYPPPFIVYESQHIDLNDKSIDAAIEVVRRGRKILPLLLENLEDKSNTNISFSCGGYTKVGPIGIISGPGGYFVDKFNFYNNLNKINLKNRVNSGEEKIISGTVIKNDGILYYVKKGEFYLELVDQIVNQRNFSLTTDGKSAKIVSPIVFKGVAEAARLEYSGLSEHEHKKLLIQSCFKFDDGKDDGLKRLIFYYPDFTKGIFSK